MSNITLHSSSVSIPIAVNQEKEPTKSFFGKLKSYASSIVKGVASVSLASGGLALMAIPNPICYGVGAAMALGSAAMSLIFMGRWFVEGRNKLEGQVKLLEGITQRQENQLEKQEKILERQAQSIDRQEEIAVRQEFAIAKHEAVLVRQEAAIERQEAAVKKQSEMMEKQGEIVGRQEEAVRVQQRTIEALRVEVYEVKSHGKTLQETTGSLQDVVGIFTSLASDMFGCVAKLSALMDGRSYVPERHLSFTEKKIECVAYQEPEKEESDIDDEEERILVRNAYNQLPPPDCFYEISESIVSSRPSVEDVIDARDSQTSVSDAGFSRASISDEIEAKPLSTTPLWVEEEITEEPPVEVAVPQTEVKVEEPVVEVKVEEPKVEEKHATVARHALSMQEMLKSHEEANKLTTLTEKELLVRAKDLASKQLKYEKAEVSKLPWKEKLFHPGFSTRYNELVQLFEFSLKHNPNYTDEDFRKPRPWQVEV